MGELTRNFNWSATSLGAPHTWPRSLRTVVSVVLTSGFPMFLWWGKDLIQFYNDAYRPSLGKDGKHPSALGGKGVDTWPEIWPVIKPLIDQVLNGGGATWSEDQLIPIYRNGHLEDVYWTFSYSPVQDDDGKIAGVLVTCAETTDKVNYLKQLTESKEELEFAIDATELGTWDLNPLTNRFIANTRLKEWFGVSANDEVDLDTAINVIADKDKRRVRDAINEALRYDTGGTYDIEYTIIHPKTGEERIVRAKGKAVFNDDKQAYRFNGTLQDITKEMIAREQNRKLSILVENSVDLMAILRMDSKNSYINAAGKELLGIDPDADVTQIPITDFHTPEQYDFVASEIIPSVMAKGKWAGQFAVKNCKTGEIIPLYNNCHRIDDVRTGEPIGVGTVMRDIRAELNARQKLEDEVAARTRELLKLNEELERKNHDLASFAFVSSHDLQEPLRKISTFISRIEQNKRESLGETNKAYFERIKNSASRMQTLISDLLTFSRTSTNEKQFEHRDLKDMLNELSEDFQERIKASGGRIIIDELPTLRVIPFQITQLFENLISNAIKFSKANTPPEIRIMSKLVTDMPEEFDSDKSFYQVSLVDNGIGFEPQYSNKIFEVFQRLHSKDVYEGTGIGLSICKRIMENHGGFIKASSKPGEGTVFDLYFPLN